MNLQTHIADDINRHHQIAMQKADEAVEHALAAGKLLLEVKASLSHGHFGAWLQASVNVSARQAQRYMAVAEGKPVPLRSISSKYDTVSHLTDESAKYKPQVSFIPETVFAYGAVVNDTGFYLVEPSRSHQGFHFVSYCAGGDACEAVHLCKPAKADSIEAVLQSYGLAEPALADWILMPNEGVSFAMESMGMPPPERGW